MKHPFILILYACIMIAACKGSDSGGTNHPPVDSCGFALKYLEDHNFKLDCLNPFKDSNKKATQNSLQGALGGVYQPRWSQYDDDSHYSKGIDTIIANTHIANYQEKIYHDPKNIEKQSFIIDAKKLKDYLNANENKFVTDLEITLGAANDTSTPGMTKLDRQYFIIGVVRTKDDSGKEVSRQHMYIGSNKNEVFQNCLPCPTFCPKKSDGVDYDGKYH